MTAARRRSAAARRGITLVELMVMLTAVAVMLGACAMLLGLAMRLEADGRQAFERSAAVGQLARRFRADVHAARSAAIDGRTLRLEAGPTRSVEYRAGEGAEIARVVVEQGKDAAREPYRIPQAVGVRLEVREIDGRRFAAVVVEVQPRQDRIDPVRPFEALAQVGRSTPTVAGAEGGKP